MRTLVRSLFSCGTDFVDWNNENCCQCAKADGFGLPGDCLFGEWVFKNLIPKEVAEMVAERQCKGFEAKP